MYNNIYIYINIYPDFCTESKRHQKVFKKWFKGPLISCCCPDLLIMSYDLLLPCCTNFGMPESCKSCCCMYKNCWKCCFCKSESSCCFLSTRTLGDLVSIYSTGCLTKGSIRSIPSHISQKGLAEQDTSIRSAVNTKKVPGCSPGSQIRELATCSIGCPE